MEEIEHRNDFLRNITKDVSYKKDLRWVKTRSQSEIVRFCKICGKTFWAKTTWDGFIQTICNKCSDL